MTGWVRCLIRRRSNHILAYRYFPPHQVGIQRDRELQEFWVAKLDCFLFSFIWIIHQVMQKSWENIPQNGKSKFKSQTTRKSEDFRPYSAVQSIPIPMMLIDCDCWLDSLTWVFCHYKQETNMRMASHFSHPVKSGAAAGRPQPTPERSLSSRLQTWWRIRLALSLFLRSYGTVFPPLPGGSLRSQGQEIMPFLPWKDFITSISEDWQGRE